SAAIGANPKNDEFAIALSDEHGDGVDGLGLWNPWWSGIWKRSRRLDRRLISAYGELRRRLLGENPVLRFVTEVPPSIATASFFFSEVGAASGPPEERHQIEFPAALARFFGEVQRHRRDLTLRRDGVMWRGRPLSYKRTTFGVEIWRLGMPTQRR